MGCYIRMLTFKRNCNNREYVSDATYVFDTNYDVCR